MSAAPAPGKDPENVRLGEGFELDLRVRRLVRAGRPVRLERIPMELLALLVAGGGELVTREQIVERIWGAGTFLDTDNGINGAIRKIRRALRDHPERPRFVQTVTGSGYRFIGRIEPEEAAPSVAPVEADGPVVLLAAPSLPEVASGGTTTAPAEPPGTLPPSAAAVRADTARRHWPALVAPVAVLLVAAQAAHVGWPSTRAPSGSQGGRSVLAVLPFENLTGDPTQEYFADGLTEEMIAQTGRVAPRRISVIARTSVMSYKHTSKAADQIGRELGADYLLEGSVRRDGQRVRITAELVQASRQTPTWSREYDRELGSLLSLQTEIADEVATGINESLGGAAGRSTKVAAAWTSAAALDAHDLYLRGRYFLNERTPEAFQQAIDYFQQAVARDPGDARAYAGLADAYALVAGDDPSRRTESMPRARESALRALQIDDRLAEAHTALALVAQDYDWDWATAEAEYRRAIDLDPNDATAHHWYGECLGLQGRFDEAFGELARARRLDPLSLIIATDDAVTLYFARQYTRAVAQLRAVLEIEPNFPRAQVLAAAEVELGHFEQALADIAAWERVDDSPRLWGLRAYVEARAGNTGEARRALAKLEALDRRHPIDPAPILLAHIGMGDKDAAFAWFEKAYEQHSTMLTTLKVDPVYDPLRRDPRFDALLRRVGLPN